MLKDDEFWDQIPPPIDDQEPYWDSNGYHEDNYGRITRSPQPTRFEQFEHWADQGYDTWDALYEDRF